MTLCTVSMARLVVTAARGLTTVLSAATATSPSSSTRMDLSFGCVGPSLIGVHGTRIALVECQVSKWLYGSRVTTGKGVESFEHPKWYDAGLAMLVADLVHVLRVHLYTVR